jgi:hypothetical protein
MILTDIGAGKLFSIPKKASLSLVLYHYYSYSGFSMANSESLVLSVTLPEGQLAFLLRRGFGMSFSAISWDNHRGVAAGTFIDDEGGQHPFFNGTLDNVHHPREKGNKTYNYIFFSQFQSFFSKFGAVYRSIVR